MNVVNRVTEPIHKKVNCHKGSETYMVGVTNVLVEVEGGIESLDSRSLSDSKKGYKSIFDFENVFYKRRK